MSTALISNSLIEIWFTYREHRAALVRLQREQADSRFPAIPQLIGTLEAAHHFGKPKDLHKQAVQVAVRS